MSRDPTKLRTQQELFVQGLVSGKTQRQAFIDAGYKYKESNMDDVDQRASKLLKSPKVFTRYNELMQEHKDRALWGRDMAFRELLELIHDSKEDRNYTGRLGAIKELNALDDLYPGEDSKDITVKDIVQLIKTLKDEDMKELLDGLIKRNN